MTSRRKFIQNIGLGTAFIATAPFPLKAYTDDADITKISILHTNDVHSRVDPFPMDGSRNQGLGGVTRRAAMIDAIRDKNEHVLLFDSGDIFQGTPYFNLYNGEVEMKAMAAMGYDAATMGNHDFDSGMENYVKQLQHGKFSVLMSNYDFKNTPLQGITHDYKIFQKGNVKIGVFGLGIELHGLVPEKLYGDTKYLDPVHHANRVASHLKNEEKCNFVICLSHLGYKYEEAKVSDLVLAKSTKDINLILGGHTHTFLNNPTIVGNLNNEEVVVNQAGFAGILLGQIDLYFERSKKGKCVTCQNHTVK
jgi:5'-nucleotidase